MSASAPSASNGVKCPIEPIISWEKIVEDGDQVKKSVSFIQPEKADNLLIRPMGKGRFTLDLYIHPSAEFTLSDAFFMHQDQIKLVKEKTVSPDGLRSFKKVVPIFKSEPNRGGYTYYFTKNGHNSMYVAAVAGNQLAIFQIGIVSQFNRFYFHKILKYKAGMYQKNKKLVIPQLDQWNGLVEFVRPMVTVSKLPKFSEYKPVPLEEKPLGNNEAEVLWVNPFGNQIALRTKKGNALCPYTSIASRVEGLIDPKPGTIVRYSHLVVPNNESRTTFPYIAKGVSFIEA